MGAQKIIDRKSIYINESTTMRTVYPIKGYALDVSMSGADKVLLWLDDTRDPSEDDYKWLVFSPIEKPFNVSWVTSYDHFVGWITTNGLPAAICFDHDLGMNVAIDARNKGMSKRQSRKLKQEEKTGYDCAKWLVNYCMDNNLDLPPYNVQSANPVGKENIIGILENFKKHRNGHTENH